MSVFGGLLNTACFSLSSVLFLPHSKGEHGFYSYTKQLLEITTAAYFSNQMCIEHGLGDGHGAHRVQIKN